MRITWRKSERSIPDPRSTMKPSRTITDAAESAAREEMSYKARTDAQARKQASIWLEKITPAIQKRLAALLETTPDSQSIQDMKWTLEEGTDLERILRDIPSFVGFTLESSLEGHPILLRLEYPYRHKLTRISRRVSTKFFVGDPHSQYFADFTSLQQFGVFISSPDALKARHERYQELLKSLPTG